MIKNLFFICLAFAAVLLSACDSTQSPSVQIQSNSTSSGAPNIAIKIPDRIRNTQAVNLDNTEVSIVTSAGPVIMTRVATPDGEQFEGTIDVEYGDQFSFTVSIFETVNGEDVLYAKTSEGSSNEVVTEDFTITLTIGDFEYIDNDEDGFSNLEERDAGSNYNNSASTPSNPEGITPTESTPGLLQFATNSYSVAELAGELAITVTRTGGSDGAVSVRYNLRSETAIVGTDVEATAGTLVWLDGDTTPKVIPITVFSDAINDGEETFTAHLFSASGDAAIGIGFATITLLDSTPPAQRGTIQFVTNSITTVDEGSQVTIEVERVGGSDGVVVVNYITVEGTAIAGDFDAITEERTLGWDDGELGSRTIRINVNNDAEVENAETFQVTLTSILGGAELGAATSTTVTINNTTLAPEPIPDPEPGVLSFSQDQYAVAEGGSIDILVQRLDGADGAVSVDYEITAGTAIAADIAPPTAGTLNWAADDTRPRTITITAMPDALLEAEELLSITLQDPTGDATIGTASVLVTINDTTIATPGTLAFSASTTSIDEGTTTTVAVTRTGGTDGAVSISVDSVTSSGYSISPATLSWADGNDTAQLVTITAASNEIADDEQTLQVQLAAATGGATIENGILTVTIIDTTVVVIPPVVEPPVVEPPVVTTPVFTPVATDGEWEVCVAPYNNNGTSAFASQLSANEGRIVSCIKTCPEDVIVDQEFAGWGWNPTDEHSCIRSTDAAGTYTKVPIYTPQREVVETNLILANFVGINSIWGCVVQTRESAEFSYLPTGDTLWYQFAADSTYQYGRTQDDSQPLELLGPEVWSVDGRVLELSHFNRGYRNTLFYPGNQTLHIHPTTDDRLNCTRVVRAIPETVVVPIAETLEALAQ